MHMLIPSLANLRSGQTMCSSYRHDFIFLASRPSLLFVDFRLLKVHRLHTVKILKFGTPQTIAIIVLRIEKFDVTLH